jgi:hypothetical protein
MQRFYAHPSAMVIDQRAELARAMLGERAALADAQAGYREGARGQVGAGGVLGSLGGALVGAALREAIEAARRRREEERRRQVECLENGGTWIPASGKGRNKVPGYCKRERQVEGP